MKKHAKPVYDYMEKVAKEKGVKLFYEDLASILNGFYDYVTEKQVQEALNYMKEIKTVVDRTKFSKRLSERN